MTIQNILDRIPPEWGRYVSVGKGWYDIIVALDHNIAELVPDYIIMQVKEKFGGLRYYIELPDEIDPSIREAVNDLINAAERMADRTCETCGQTGELRGGSWYRVLCDPCENRRIQERNELWKS